MIYAIRKTQLYISFSTPEGRRYLEEYTASLRKEGIHYDTKETESGAWVSTFSMEEIDGRNDVVSQ